MPNGRRFDGDHDGVPWLQLAVGLEKILPIHMCNHVYIHPCIASGKKIEQ